MAKKRKRLKILRRDRSDNALNNVSLPPPPSAYNSMYPVSPVKVSPTSEMGVRFEDTWVSELQVSGDFKQIGLQIVDNIAEDHDM